MKTTLAILGVGTEGERRDEKGHEASMSPNRPETPLCRLSRNPPVSPTPPETRRKALQSRFPPSGGVDGGVFRQNAP